MRYTKFHLVWVLGLFMLICSCESKNKVKRDASGNIIVNTDPSSEYLSPAESMETIHMPDGYSLQLVASEPMIHEPVAIAWDANGRLFVAEMNTYMQDIDGSDEMKPICTVKRLEDTDGDGVMDKAVVFIDSLVLPRMILALDDRLLVNETNSNNIYSYRDTDGDGIADEKKLIFRNDVISTSNLEHQKSGLIWNLDNRMYVTVENVRYKYENGMLKAEHLHEGPGGQWGLGNDDYGRLYFSAAGAETPALNFQQNPSFGRLDFEDQYDADFQSVWPIISTPDVQGGLPRLRADSTLNHFTACTGQSIYRGNTLPADLKGDLLICEPVGRLVRRAKITNTEGKITMRNAYDKQEFMASTDMNFRPVNSATGPDGSLYIVDMYRGIIQEGEWTKVGSFLRTQILNKKLDKNIGRGRIYRVVYDGIKPDKTQPKMLSQPSSELVQYLSHPNGWWRDNAQKLMVVRGDKSVVPALKKLALESPVQLARIHALWTLDGLNSLDQQTLKTSLQDKDAEVRKTAVWIAADAVKNGDAKLIDILEPLKNDSSADVRFQLALTLRFNQSGKAKSIIQEMIASHPDNAVMTESEKKYQNSLQANALSKKNANLLEEADRKLVLQGALIFKQLCVACHGADGKGAVNGGKDMPAPALAGNKNVTGDPEKLIKILLHGLHGPINGKNYTDVMPALGGNDDDYIASALSYIRNDIGNKANVVKADDVKRVRNETKGRTASWTWTELNAAKK